MNKNIVLAAVALAVGLMNFTARSQDTKGFKLKNRSAFTLQEPERNPFWPIGWVKTATTTANTNETVQVAEIRPEDFTLSAILLGTPPMAVINGKEYAEGEFIVFKVGGPKTKVLVAQVMDGKVILRYMNRDYTVILHRKGEESVNKKAAPTPPQDQLE